MSAPPSLPQAARSTDSDAARRRHSTRRLTFVLLALAGASCLAAAVLVGVVLWRSSLTLTSVGTATPSPAQGSTPIGDAAEGTPTASDGEGPAEGGLTDPELKAQVWSTIMSFYTNVRGCTDVSSTGIRVSQEPDSSGSWEETWDVSACGAGAELKIQFTAAPDGGFYYDITEQEPSDT